MSDISQFRLRHLGPGARVGIACLVLVLLGGTGGAGMYMYMHHENRDESPGLTITDIKGHYHGVQTPSKLGRALESGHPEGLDPDVRTTLLEWLRGDRISADYDNLDLGDMAPQELIIGNCLECHARSSRGPDAHPQVPLEYWDDVRDLAVSRDIQPVDLKILAASTHTHALSIAAMSIVLSLLLLATSWSRRFVGALLCATGVALLLDISSWWLARRWIDFAYVIVIAGAIFNGGIVLTGLAVLADLFMPRSRRIGD